MHSLKSEARTFRIIHPTLLVEKKECTSDKATRITSVQLGGLDKVKKPTTLELVEATTPDNLFHQQVGLRA